MRFAGTIVLGFCLSLSTQAVAADARQCDLDYIGTMTMDLDGAVHALLNICDAQAGAQGHKYLSYWKGEPDHAVLLTLVGGIRPGETKPIPAPKDKPSL